MDKISSFHNSGKRYASLRLIGAILTLLGAVLLAIGVLLLAVGLYALVGGMTGSAPQVQGVAAALPINASPSAFWLVGVFSLYWGFGVILAGLQLIAMGALCRLMIHMVENTRASAQILDRIRSRLEPEGDAVQPLFRS